MPRTTTPGLLVTAVTAVAALVLAGGCTSTVPGAAAAGSAPAQGGGDTVAWVDKICGSLLPYIRSAGSPPKASEAPDPAAMVEDIDAYLINTADSADAAIDGMTAAGPAPVAGGDQVVDGLRDTLAALQTSLHDVRGRIQQIDVKDREAVRREVPAAIASLNKLSTSSPVSALRSNPELNQAGQEAANCQQIAREVTK